MATASKTASTSTPNENRRGLDVKNAHHTIRHRIADSEIIPTPNTCNDCEINVASEGKGDNSESSDPDHSKDRGYVKIYVKTISTLFAAAFKARKTILARHPIRHGIADDQMIPTPNASDGNGDISESSGDIKKISTLFVISHGAIIGGVVSMSALGISSQVRKTMLLVSALASTAIIGAFVVKSFQELSRKRDPRSLRNSLVANWCWVTQRIALFLMFTMLSLCLWLVSDWLLKLHHN